MKRDGNTKFEPKRLPGYSESELIKEIQRVVEIFDGKIPNSTQFEAESRASLGVIHRRFGSYAKAIAKAGFAYTKRLSPNKYTRKQVLENLREVLVQSEGYEFSYKFYRTHGGLYSQRAQVARSLDVKTWKDAMAIVGAKRRPKTVRVTAHSLRLSHLAKLTTEDLLKELDLVWQVKGHCPSRPEFNQVSKIHAGVLLRRFGSWSKAIELLCRSKGVPIHRISGTALTKNVSRSDQHESPQSAMRYDLAPLTREDLINEIQLVQRKHPGIAMTFPLYKSGGGSFCKESFIKRFGSWTKAIEASGSVPGLRTYSKEELFDEMQRLWEQLGRQPTFDEMNEHGKISPATYHKRFGSWIKAIHAFCDDRNSDPAPETPPELPSSISVANEAQRSVLPAKTPSATPLSMAESPPLIVLRETSRAVPKRLRFRVLERDKHTCQVCGRSREKHGISLEADHIVAYSKGRETVFENLQALCEDCNKGKSNL